MLSLFKLLVVVFFGLTTQYACAQNTRTNEVSTTQKNTNEGVSNLDRTDMQIANIWNISAEEMQRYKLLMKGPRGSFSVPGISPLEVLGIHARTEAERTKYAEQFAKMYREDVQRSLAWNVAYEAAMRKLYPASKVIDYSGLPKVNATVGAADAMNVPRSMIYDNRPVSASTTAAQQAAQPVETASKTSMFQNVQQWFRK